MELEIDDFGDSVRVGERGGERKILDKQSFNVAMSVMELEVHRKVAGSRRKSVGLSGDEEELIRLAEEYDSESLMVVDDFGVVIITVNMLRSILVRDEKRA